jgi:hypothetical protein
MEHARCIITLQRPIAFEKGDHVLANPYSKFILRVDNITIAHGSVLRYNPNATV